MIKKITRLISDLFIYNAVGWILVFANFAVIYFLIWVTSDVYHTQMPSNGKPYKLTILSSYKVNGIALADFVMIWVMILNSPALYLSDFFYQTFFTNPAVSVLTTDKGCKFCWFYISQIGCDVLFITIQWLAIGWIVRKLCKLVKDS